MSISAYRQPPKNPHNINLLLVRHARSASNNDHSVHKHLADHKVPLSEVGLQQAHVAGQQILKQLTLSHGNHPSPILASLWVSPFLRTRQTAKAILHALLQAKVRVRIYERVELVEQLFGMYSGHDEDEWAVRYPEAYAEYNMWCQHGGKFFAKMLNGESRFDVYNRLSPLVDAIVRKHQDRVEAMRLKLKALGYVPLPEPAEVAMRPSNNIVISHGVTLRMLTKHWMKYSIEWAEQEPNPANVSIRSIQARKDLGYVFPGFNGDTLDLATAPTDRELTFFDYGLS